MNENPETYKLGTMNLEQSDRILRENAVFYRSYYDKPRWWFFFRYDTQYKVKAALDALRRTRVFGKGLSVLEIGYGSGELLFRFDKSTSIFGVEVSESALTIAAKRAAQHGYRRFDFQALKAHGDDLLPFEGGKFHLVIASHVLEHVDNADAFVEAVKRRLTDGGHVLILVPINERYDDPKHQRKFTSKSCAALFEEHGFRAIYCEENEYLYHLVEPLYWKNYQGNWSLKDNLKRVAFNLAFSLFPMFAYRMTERLIKVMTSLPPRQAVLVFQKS